MSPQKSPPGRRPVKGKGPAGPRRATAKERALGLLAVRWRSRAELRRRLTLAGYETEEIDLALSDLEQAGLVEDVRFARELVRDQASRKLAGDRAIRSALRQKGIASEVVEAALDEAGDEAERAEALAESRARRLGHLPPEVAYRRVFSLLVRRGYGSSLAREVSRRALADIFPTPPPD
jgi:regulatory protein